MNTSRPSPVPRRSKGRRVDAAPGVTLMAAARAAGLPVASSCAGRGACGWCRITVLEGAITSPDARESALLDKLGARAEERIACLARALGPVTIATDYW